jgi:RNA polymerase sigma-70 factor, ECF subfamily
VRAIARREALRVVAGERALEELNPNDAAVEAPNEQVHMRIDVHRAVAELSSAERLALAACYWLGLTDRQLAAHLGIPVGTAKVRLHRTRMRLRALLAEQVASNAPISTVEH